MMLYMIDNQEGMLYTEDAIMELAERRRSNVSGKMYASRIRDIGHEPWEVEYYVCIGKFEYDWELEGFDYMGEGGEMR